MNLCKLILFCIIFHISFGRSFRTNYVNQIINGDFNVPVFTGTQFTTKQTLFGWSDGRQDQIKFVKASVFNSQYQSNDQALAISYNSNVYQHLNLSQKEWQLTFSVGLAANSFESTQNFTSQLKVIWNDQVIYDINPITPSIQYVKARVTSRNGRNKIEFAGNGNQEYYFDDVLVDDISLLQIIDVKGQQIYAGLSGAGKITFSTYMSIYENGRSYIHNNYLLDYYFPGQPGCWSPQIQSQGQWAQISTDQIRQWIAVVTQGRNDDWSQGTVYVKKYKIFYTVNGIDWTWAEDEKVFNGNQQGINKKRINFVQPIFAIGLRIYPTEWKNNINMRFDAIYRM